MSALIYVLVLGAAGGIARRFQGVAHQTWSLDRVPWRMLAVWGPVGIALGGGAVLLGAPLWAAALGLFPGLWGSLPGKWNNFFLDRWIASNAWREGVAGGVVTALVAALAVGTFT